MKNIDNVLKAIKELYKGGSTDDPKGRRKLRMNNILQPLLQFLEVITTQDLTKDNLNSNRIYDSIISLINDKISLQNRSYMINILFNLHLKLSSE